MQEARSPTSLGRGLTFCTGPARVELGGRTLTVTGVVAAGDSRGDQYLEIAQTGSLVLTNGASIRFALDLLGSSHDRAQARLDMPDADIAIGSGVSLHVSRLLGSEWGGYDRTFTLVRYRSRSGRFRGRPVMPPGVHGSLIYDDAAGRILIRVHRAFGSVLTVH